MKKVIFFSFFVVIACMICNVSAAEVKTGTYKIISALDDNKMLVEKNGNIVLGDDNTDGITTWDIYSNGDTYCIKSHDGNYSIDLDNAKLVNTQNIKLFNVNNSKAQKWYLNHVQDSYYYITSSLGNYNIDVRGGNSNNDTNIQLYKNNGSAAQKWKFLRVDQNEKMLEDGTYIIKSKLNTSNVIDLYGANTNNGTNIQMYLNNFTWAQVWNLKYSDGYYSITSYLDNEKSVDVYGNSLKRKTNVWLYNSNSTTAQKYVISGNEDNTYSIKSYDGLWTFDVANGSSKLGANLWLYSPNGTDAQKFIIEKVNIDPIETGYYVINSIIDENKVVGVNNPAIFNGKNVELRTNEDHNNTKWYIEKIGGDIYNIASSENKKYFLGLKNNSISSGTNVELNNTNKTDVQRWCIRKNDDGSYSIMNVKSGKNLDISGGNSSEGTNILIYNSNGTNAQKFKFTETIVSSYSMAYEEGRYEIKSVINNNMVLDIMSGRKTNVTNVQVYTSNSSAAQNWRLEYIGDGVYIIRSYINPNLVLTASGENAVSSKYTKNDYQKWYFDKNGSVTNIINMGNGKYLNINSENPTNKTNVSLSNNKSRTSEFVLSKPSSVIKYRGVDLSEFNTVKDWDKLVNEIDFVVIRSGFGEEKIINGKDAYQDSKYIENVRKCEEKNIPYAIYFYSYANKLKSSDKPSYNTTNIDSADSEASHMIKLMKSITNLGYYPTLSTDIYFDQEETGYIYNKVKNYYAETDSNNPKTRKLLTDIINDFCNRMNNNGYTCGVYSSSNWLNNRINAVDVAKKNSIWVAEWPGYTTFNQGLQNKPSYNKTSYKLWQFSSSGAVSGIDGRVDLDIGYNIFE